MTSRFASRVVRSLTFTAVATCLLPGCASFQEKLAQGVRPRTGPASSHAAGHGDIGSTLDVDDLAEHDKMMITAVEEFLARTQDYGEPSHADTPVSAPQTQTMSSKVAPISTATAGQKVGPLHTQLPGERVVDPPVSVVANTHVALTDHQVPEQQRPALPVLQAVRIRTALPTEVPVDQLQKTTATNVPVEIRTGEAAVSVDRFVEQLETRAVEADDFDSQWSLRLVQAALNLITEPPELSSSIPQDAKRILGSLIRLVAATRSVARDPLSGGEEALRRVDDLRQVLADRADPVVSEIALCRSVVTFGVYDELEADLFVAGRTTQAIAYSEIRNLRSEQTPDGQYRTLLATRLEVLTEGGESVWQQEEPEIEDLCRKRRTDFFIAQRITLPPTLSEGDYILKVFVEDRLSGKANETSHRFTVHSAASLASGR